MQGQYVTGLPLELSAAGPLTAGALELTPGQLAANAAGLPLELTAAQLAAGALPLELPPGVPLEQPQEDGRKGKKKGGRAAAQQAVTAAQVGSILGRGSVFWVGVGLGRIFCVVMAKLRWF